MSRRDSGVFYYSEVEPQNDELKDNKFHTIASFKNPKMKSTNSTKNINFKVMNNTIAGKGVSIIINHHLSRICSLMLVSYKIQHM
jgi:hypothetical protein